MARFLPTRGEVDSLLSGPSLLPERREEEDLKFWQRPEKISEDYTAGEWLGTAARNIPYSVAERFRETGEFISDPGAALSAMGSIASGAWDVATGDESEEAELARNVWEEIKAQTTDPRRIAEDPTAAIANIATLVAPFAGGTAAAARAAGVGGKAASTLGKIAKAADIAADLPMMGTAKLVGRIPTGRGVTVGEAAAAAPGVLKKIAKRAGAEVLGVAGGKRGSRTMEAYEIGKRAGPRKDPTPEFIDFEEARTGQRSEREIGAQLLRRLREEEAFRVAKAEETAASEARLAEEIAAATEGPRTKADIQEIELQERDLGRTGFEDEPLRGPQTRKTIEKDATTPSGYADINLSDLESGDLRKALKKIEVPTENLEAYWDWYANASPQERARYLEPFLAGKASTEKGIRVIMDIEDPAYIVPDPDKPRKALRLQDPAVKAQKNINKAKKEARDQFANVVEEMAVDLGIKRKAWRGQKGLKKDKILEIQREIGKKVIDAFGGQVEHRGAEKAVRNLDEWLKEADLVAQGVGTGMSEWMPEGLVGRLTVAGTMGAGVVAGLSTLPLTVVAAYGHLPRAQAYALSRIGRMRGRPRGKISAARYFGLGLQGMLKASGYAVPKTMTVGEAMERLHATEEKKAPGSLKKRKDMRSLLQRLQPR